MYIGHICSDARRISRRSTFGISRERFSTQCNSTSPGLTSEMNRRGRFPRNRNFRCFGPALSSYSRRLLLTTAINTRVLVTRDVHLLSCAFSRLLDRRWEAASLPGNSFHQHVCDSVVPRKSVVGPPSPSCSSPPGLTLRRPPGDSPRH